MLVVLLVLFLSGARSPRDGAKQLRSHREQAVGGRSFQRLLSHQILQQLIKPLIKPLRDLHKISPQSKQLVIQVVLGDHVGSDTSLNPAHVGFNAAQASLNSPKTVFKTSETFVHITGKQVNSFVQIMMLFGKIVKPGLKSVESAFESIKSSTETVDSIKNFSKSRFWQRRHKKDRSRIKLPYTPFHRSARLSSTIPLSANLAAPCRVLWSGLSTQHTGKTRSRR